MYPELTPRSCVVGIDTTYFGRTSGVTIFRDITNCRTLFWRFVQHENTTTYDQGIDYIINAKVAILGFVVDGFPSFFVHYANKYDLQMCQKHMKDIVRRCITNHPKTIAAQELKHIMSDLVRYSEHEFNCLFEDWLVRWHDFLKERTYADDKRSWVYTHQRLRKAANSIIRYKPYLFSYQKNKWLPNTNNSIEGFNSSLKGFINIHKGLRSDRKAKLIHAFLAKDSEFMW